MLKLYKPLKNMLITQKFGENAVPAYKDMGLLGHNGLDMRASDGTAVHASHDGRVVFAGYDGGGGLGVVIRTNEPVMLKDGSMSLIKTLYWHLKRGSLLVTGGDSVEAGQPIGEADNTGMSTGSHLHFGMKPIYRGEKEWEFFNSEDTNGYKGAVDPEPYLEVPVVFQYEMKYGDKDDDIVIMQAFFLREGLMKPIREDEWGWYGRKTANAVLDFQKMYCKLSWYEQCILRGNRVGFKTLLALNKYYK